MAPSTLKIAFAGPQGDIALIEKALKEFFPPRRFEVIPVRVGEEVFQQTIRKIPNTSDEQIFLGGPKYSREQALTTLSNLQQNIHLHAGIVLGHDSVRFGPNVESHSGFRAIVLDPYKGQPRGFNDVMPFVSDWIAPYGDPTGATSQQLEQGLQRVLRGAIEGWKRWSSRHDSTLKRLGLA